MMPAVLLHIAQDPDTIGWFGALAGGALAGAAGVAGGAAAAFGASRRFRAALLATMAVWTFAFIAVLPSVLPYDHLFVTAIEGDSAVHASHCHDAPGSCADAPLTAGPGQMLSWEPLIPTLPLTATLLIIAVPLLYGIAFRPEIRPPMQARRFATS